MRRWLTASSIQSVLGTLLSSLVLGTVLYVSIALADSKPRERARYNSPDEQGSYLRFTPLALANGSKLTVISPSRWSDLAEDLAESLHDAHAEYTELFTEIPAFSSSIRLMDEESFYELTGAPSWTNAMFFRGEIIIPLSEKEPIDLDNLHRSVKHEFTHAVLSAMSGGQIPGWIDEGIAQWAEGYEHPALREALRKWLTNNEPVPLGLLQGGFTKLDPLMVPSAYAESLLASKAMIQAFGFKKIGAYLTLLKKGVDKSLAFEASFGITEEEFETKLSETLKTWAAIPGTASAKR